MFLSAILRLQTRRMPLARRLATVRLPSRCTIIFLKGLDQVREGGLIAFITSQGVMNAASPFVRMELVKQADLVAALRLPNNTFQR